MDVRTSTTPIPSNDVAAILSQRVAQQQARNLSLCGALEDVRFLVRDRDSKFVAGFDEVFRTEGVEVILTPFRSPQANAHAARSYAPHAWTGC